MDKIKYIPKTRIENIVRSELHKYLWLTNKKRLSFPLDPEDVFKVLYDLETIYVDFDSVGLREPNKEQVLGAISVRYKKILVHTGQIYPGGPLVSKEIKRFSVAHEGSHYLLHHFNTEILPGTQMELFSPQLLLRKNKNNFVCGSYLKYDPLEFQANYCGASLLIPKDHLLETISSLKLIDLQKWGNSLCNKFGVSRKCLECRLNSLRIKCKNARYIKGYHQLSLNFQNNFSE